MSTLIHKTHWLEARAKLAAWFWNLIDLLAKAHYHEVPVENEQGRVIGYICLTPRCGSIFYTANAAVEQPTFDPLPPDDPWANSAIPSAHPPIEPDTSPSSKKSI